MRRGKGALGGAALLIVAGLIAAGCGESVEDAEAALCADLQTLRSNVQTLADTSSETTVKEFENARENVRESWVDVRNAAINLGEERFDDVEDAWDDIDGSLGDVDNNDTLAEAKDKITAKLVNFDSATDELGTKINCSSASA